MIDRTLKKEYMSFALNAGGSTYPEVNTKYLEWFADSLIQECIAICEAGTKTQTTCSGAAQMIKIRFGLLPSNQNL